MTPKTILCIRHGQSTYNARNPATGIDPLLYDARLSEAGEKQVEAAREKLRDVPIELVISSPLTRALQTAVGLFADHPSAPPIVVEALHRERVENSCDIGRSPALLSVEFPLVSLTHLPDVWWHNEGTLDDRGVSVEPIDLVKSRANDFKRLLRQRPERRIAVVGHGTFFYYLVGQALSNCEVFELSLEHVDNDMPALD